MLLAILIMPLAAAAAQSSVPTAASASRPPTHRGRRLFVSPMGEPFVSGKAGDALGEWFQTADGNHDGSLTKDEMQADADRFFALLDVNHDAEIDPDEITRYETQIAPSNRKSLGLLDMSEPVTSADANFNRGVSLEEFRSAAKHRFAALDVNHQGRLTLELLQSLRPPAPPRERRNFDAAPGLDANADTGGG